MFKKYGFLLFFFPVLLNAGFGDWFYQQELSPKAKRAITVLEDFDPVIEKALKDYNVPGVAIGIVVDGQIVYTKGFGYRNVEQKLPVTKDTLFAIGSCTKAFTTFAIGNLVDEEQIKWDQPVIDILPEFRLADQYATTNVTLRDLLTHRSGMPRHEFVWYNSKMTKGEMLKRLRYLQPSFNIRQRYQYGNLMYFTAGVAMERVAGKPWGDQIRERILIPLEMTQTNFSIEETQKTSNFAYPYLEKEEQLKRIAFRNLSLIDSAGALNSNINDMTHWLQMLLAGGVYKEKMLINPATLQELFAPQVIVSGAPECEESLPFAYGIGWNVFSYRGHYFVSHDGVSDGFTSVTGLFPKDNVGIVILTNRNMTTFPRYISLEIIDRLLELPPRGRSWLEEGLDGVRKNKEGMKAKKQREDKLHKKGMIHSHPIEEYVGVYEHPGYGKLYVDLVDGKLQATYNDLTFVLGHWHYDIFRISEEKQDMVLSFEGMKFTFNNNANGEISELVVPFEPTADDIIFKRQREEKLSNMNYLRQFIGAYEIYGYTVEIVVRNHALLAIIPGQPNYELLPTSENEFVIKEMTRSTVRFMMGPNNQVEEILLIHPYGAFTANPKR